jgi:hypothetical protein
MKTFSSFLVIAGLAGALAYSQPPRNDGGNDRGRPGPPPRDGVLQLFDTDENGEISMKEIDNAIKILKALDRDRNGVLTPDELPRPPRPGDDGGRRGNNPPRPRGDAGRGRESQAQINAPAGTVVISGGDETDRQDRGRPVALIAAALGVKSEVFRQAFSKVNPARGGDPSAAVARANKQVLMAALGKHGITNNRLDEVSNFYRYQQARGESWRRTPATAKAIIKNGKVTGFTITNAGAGYSSPPYVRVAGHNVRVKATIAFSKDFKTNGRITSLTVVEGRADDPPARAEDGRRPAGRPPERNDRDADQQRRPDRPRLEE